MSTQPPAWPAPEVANPVPPPTPVAVRPLWVGWPMAVLQTARPWQWPKNLLVFAAPIAGSAREREHGLSYACLAFVVFTLASCAVYFVNDVVDADRDRAHPRKRTRPIASGRLAARHALVVAGVCVGLAEAGALAIHCAGLVAAVTAYLVISFLYSCALKHLPVVELAVVASGFVLRALGGAAAAKVPPSGWFVLMCSLGALLVAISKRYTELSGLGPDAAQHRPCLRLYTRQNLRVSQRAVGVAMIASYLSWALLNGTPWAAGWHLVAMVPLALALVRFDWLTVRAPLTRVEDLITRDLPMVGCELLWLLLFIAAMRG